MVKACRSTVLVIAALWITACSTPATPRLVIQEAVTAMGGGEKLQGINTLSMRGGTGTRTKVGQPVKAGDMDVMAQLKNVNETVDIAGGRASLDYELAIGEFGMHRHEILTKKDGKLVGIENVVPRPIIATSPGGLFSWGTQNSPEFLLRRNVVSVVRAVMDAAPDSGSVADEQFNGRTLKHFHFKAPSGEDIGLYFDPMSKLLAAYEVLDTESMLGDVVAQYLLDDYKAVDGVTLPHRITIRKGGNPYSEVTFSSIAINDPAAEQVFAIPESAAKEAELVVAADEYTPMKINKVGNGVYQAQGYSHHSLIVEFPQYLAIVDAPYTNTQTKILARTLEQQFPGKPIRYVGVSHHHFDHIGGIREAAALGATILLEKGQEPALRPILEARHTNPQDELDKRRHGQPAQQVGAIEVYEGKKVITEGGQTLELHGVTGGPHAEPFVLGFAPAAGAVFTPDIYTPGTPPGGGGPPAEHLLKSVQASNLKVTTMVGGHGGIGPFADFVKAATPAVKPSSN